MDFVYVLLCGLGLPVSWVCLCGLDSSGVGFVV